MAENTGRNIVQYPDNEGNRAYVKTHIQAVDGLSDQLVKGLANDYLTLKSPDGTFWKLTVNNEGRLITERMGA